MKHIVKILIILFPLAAYAFDYGSYEKTTLDSIFKRSDELVKMHSEDKGVSIISPTVRAEMTGEITKMPYECSNGALFKFMSLVGFNLNNMPKINYCINLKSKTGRVAVFHIQDSLVGFVNEEVIVGDSIKVWALWVYTNTFEELPYLLINGYEAVIPPNKANQAGTH